VILAAQSDHSGAIVTASPGGASDTTDAAGNYEISGLYATTYTVTASKAGYVSGVQAGVVVTQGNTTPNVNLALSPQSSVQYCLSPGLAIPENDPAGVTSVINVVESFPVSEVEVAVDITHTYIGDLIVEIRHGVKTVRLHNRTGGSTDNIVGTYPTTLSVSGPGTLGDFLNDSSDGAWTLFVSDNANIDIGTINSWCITIKGVAQNLTSVDPGSRVPVAYALSQSLPNPAPGGGAAIAFAIPREDRVSLGVFDVSGRLVRSLVDMRLPAGFHTARWDGRNAKGDDVAAGVYLYRLDATGYQSTRKLVIVR
jgi:subtilisin-like proprotein convertase family protein